MFAVCRTIITVLCALACARPGAATTLECSISTSRQFLVYGSDVHLRGAIGDLAEEAKRDLLKWIGQRDEWVTPIVVHAQYPQANVPEIPRAVLNLSQTGFGLKIQLNLTITSDVTQPELRRELLNALVLEMMYRYKPDVPAGTAYARPPEWLLAGLETPGLSGGWAGNMTTHAIPSLEEFLRQQPDSLDAVDHSLYCAYSFALVELLAHLPGGRMRLARFISDLPSAVDTEVAQIQRYFPELSDPGDGSQKLWLSHIAGLAAGQFCQLLSAAETEQMLSEILGLRIAGIGFENSYQLHDFPMFMRSCPAKPALLRLGRDLSALIPRANPIYRPAIFEYEKVVALLACGKTRGIAERLTRLKATRKALVAQMRKIDDYMNWFEATQTPRGSGAFDNYMKAADLADRPGEEKHDPISVYLDVLETQFQNERHAPIAAEHD